VVTVEYDHIRHNNDGSLTADVTLTNKKSVVYHVIFENTGNVSAPHNALSWDLVPLLPKRRWSVPITFHPQSSVTFKLSKLGHTPDGISVVLGLDIANAFTLLTIGEYLPTKPTELIPGVASGIVDLINHSIIDFSEAILKGHNNDWRGALESTFDSIKNSPQTVHSLLVLTLNNPPSMEEVKRWLQRGKQIISIATLAPFVWDFIFAPSDVQVTISRDYFPSLPPIESPPLLPALDSSLFLSHVTYSVDTVVSPNQPIHKTWRVKNTGNRIWGPDHKLVFIGGNQMGTPNEVNIPLTEPGGVADISIDITAPGASGTHRGEWRLRNSQGTFFGDKLWVQIVVPETNNPQPPNASTMQLTCVNDCPSTVAPGQSFRPTVRVSGSVPLLQSRGDMLRNTDGNRYGAYEFVAVSGAVNQGQSYDFTFYAQNPITAPNTESVYESKWRIWQNGGWVGPEYTIRFEVKAGTGVNHPPNTPTLTDPGDWAVYNGNSGITLQAQHNGDPNGDAITHYYFEIFESAQTPNSGWITSNSWSPAGLGNYGFQWRVKVRDARGAESGWSEVRHFNINDPNPQIQSFTWTWCHEPWGAPDKICFCAQTTGGGLELKLNSANDGSDRGAWKVIGHGDTNLNCNNDNDRPPNWGQLEVPAGNYRVRLFARPKGPGGWAAAATADVVVSLPANQRPGSPFGLAPAHDEFVNSKTVKMDWQTTYRTTTYRLQVSLDPNFGTSLVDTQLPPDVSEYTYTFADEYETVYWQVLATGPYGTNDSGRRPFHIDLTPPSSSITALPVVTTDTKFNVNWGGVDARSGLRWYHIQVRDGKRTDSQWSDWLVNTTKTAELFVGQPGHAYYFRVRAMDALGTWEEWPVGDGDTYTLVNPSAIPPTTWWNSGFLLKRNLIILNNDGDSIPAQSPIQLHFDSTTSPTAAEIYEASSAPVKGDDIRIVYNNQTEVARYILRFTPTAIDLWFPYQLSLGSGQTDNGSHQLYYGNAQASNPPADVNIVFQPKVDGNTMGLWHFQEGSGTTVFDASGRGHHGNFINSGWTDGYWGRAGSFNGSNTYVEIGHSDDFKPGAITLEAWIYLTGPTGEYPMIFNKDRYWLRLTGGGELQFIIKADGGDRTITGQSRLTQNKWYHVVATYNGGQVMRLFINGKLDREQTNGAPPVLWNTHPLRIGRSDYNANSYFPGYIQHARISNVARADFSYGAIDIAPAVAAGSPIAPPVPGVPDLTVLGLNTYPNPTGGVIIEALVQNQGNRETQNGFYTDLYLDHLPTGAGDYTGSTQFWVNSPIAAGATVTLTTVLTNFNSSAVVAAQSQAPAAEITHLLYMQTDSAGVVPDADKANNILSTGVEVCFANPDAFEGDDVVTQAATLPLNQAQSHNFSNAGDQDWVKFNAEAGKEYTFSTRNLGLAADTYLYLYDTDGATLLTANDDGNDTLASQIRWTAPASATYYLLVRHWNPNVAGCGSGYELVAEVTQSTPPTPTFTPTFTPTATPDIQPAATTTPTPTATSIDLPDSTNHMIYLPSIQQNSGSTLPVINGTPTPMSPSSTIAFVSDRDGNYEIYRMNISNPQSVTRLTNNTALDYGPDWSPDGSKIAFDSDRDGKFYEIYVMNADGTGQTRLTNNTFRDAGAAWSPSGSKIAFASDRDGNFYEIYVMNADGSNPTRLTNNTIQDAGPDWSPDGTKIAYASWLSNDNIEIYVMNADGTGQTRLTNVPGFDDAPHWSPDGTKIVFASWRNGVSEIYVMNADGSNQRRLTNNSARDFVSDWSPDGQTLIFRSDRDGNWELYTMNTDGSGQTRLTNTTSFEDSATWKP
jgi:Tol biopolymer transport system component